MTIRKCSRLIGCLMLSVALFLPSISLITWLPITAKASNTVDSDVSEEKLKSVIKKAASELDWSVGNIWDHRYSVKSNISPLEYGPNIWGPKLVEFHSGVDEILKEGASYGLSFRVASGSKTGKDVLPTSNGYIPYEGPYKIDAYQNESIAKDYIQQKLLEADPNDIHDFHGWNSIYSKKSICWQSDRFIFIVNRNWSGTKWDKSITTTKEQIAEALYSAALSQRLISNNEDSAETDKNPENVDKPRIFTNLNPTFFQKVGDSIDFKVTLKDPDNNVIPGESISLINLNNQIKVNEKITDKNGNAVFVLINSDPDVVNYTYEVKALGIMKAVQIPVVTVNIDLEINPETNLPFVGVVADGQSKLKLCIQLSGMTSGDDFKITKEPDFGTLEGKAFLYGGNVDLNSVNPVVYFVPPTTIPTSMINNRDESLNCGFVVSTFIFTYTSMNGGKLTFPFEIAIYRPPVFLLHDENNTSLQRLSSALIIKQFNTYIVDSSAIKFDELNEQYIQDQTTNLRQYIHEHSLKYSEKNIKLSKVDVVGHGIGGLISRSYCNNPDSNIRKLIMLGTPNHGFSWSSFQTDEIEKYSNQSIIDKLNVGEDTGSHLNDSVEYGNIFSYSTKVGFFSGDAFVSSASAYLNGVETYITKDNTHSTLFKSLGTPLTEDILVFSKIRKWLESTIQKPPLKTMRARVIKAEGNVFLKAQDIIEKQKFSTPLNISFTENTAVELNDFDTLTTEDGKAIVAVYMNDIPWGYVFLDEDTEMIMKYASPISTQVKLVKGKARFTTFHIFDIGHFSVELQDKNSDWTTITGLETDFLVNTNVEEVTAYVIKGNAVFNSLQKDSSGKDSFIMDSYSLKKNYGIQYSKSDEECRPDLPKTKWWEDYFYSKNTIGWLIDYCIQINNTYKIELAQFKSDLDESSLSSVLPKAFTHYKTVIFVFGLAFIVFVMLMNVIYKEKWLRLVLIPFVILALLFLYTYLQSGIILKLL